MHSINSKRATTTTTAASCCNVCTNIHRLLKTQIPDSMATVWRIWCFVSYISFGLFLYIYKYIYFSLNSPRFRCCCCCYCCYLCVFLLFFISSFVFFFCLHFFLYLETGYLMLFHAQQCADMYNMKQARCTYKSEKFLVKKRENLPLTTCIYLSQIRCVSFIVYHTHIWSFHSILLPFACSFQHPSWLFLLSCLSFNQFFVRFFSLMFFFFFFFPQVYSFGFLRSSSWDPHRLHLFPIVTQELRLLSLCIQRL